MQIIRKETFKDYFKPGCALGVIFGGLSCLISFIDGKNSLRYSLIMGLIVWSVMVFIFGGIAFLGHEYFERKRCIKRLKSKKYSFLHEADFQLHSDLFFENTYKEYFIRILPMTKWQNPRKKIEYDIIEAYYTFPAEEDKEDSLTGNYFLGKLYFSNHCVGFIPKDWMNPNFKNNLDGLISILKRENLKPFSKKDWESSFGKKLK